MELGAGCISNTWNANTYVLSLSHVSVSHRCIYHVYCTLSLSVCYVKVSTAVVQSYSASCICIVGLSALGTDNSSLLCCHLMHLSVLTTSLKLATEHPASQVSTCLSTGDCWLFTLLTFVKACAALPPLADLTDVGWECSPATLLFYERKWKEWIQQILKAEI